uniref:Uncharacterized protein n=1 Tax=Anguilla anguilla TaxID=7936 RepID=A0A0E9VTA5_ANGAN
MSTFSSTVEITTPICPEK